jgi:Domain of unknown function (DUF4919)
MRLEFTFFLLINVLSSYSQGNFQTINRDSVEKEVTDTAADTFYPKLLTRFNNFDSTLTNGDYRLLYYGFVFQNNYAGDADEDNSNLDSALQNKNYGKASNICDGILENDPVSLYANYHKALALYLKDKEDPSFRKYAYRYKNLLNAIISSGDGFSCKTSFRTICVHDEYEVMYNYFDIEQISGQSLEYPCDKITLTPSVRYSSNEMFFDTSEPMMYMDNLMKGNHHEKRKNSN